MQGATGDGGERDFRRRREVQRPDFRPGEKGFSAYPAGHVRGVEGNFVYVFTVAGFAYVLADAEPVDATGTYGIHQYKQTTSGIRENGEFEFRFHESSVAIRTGLLFPLSIALRCLQIVGVISQDIEDFLICLIRLRMDFGNVRLFQYMLDHISGTKGLRRKL